MHNASDYGFSIAGQLPTTSPVTTTTDRLRPELDAAISIAKDCLENMIERARENASIVELVEFGKVQLGGDFDPLFATLVHERSEAARAERMPRRFLVSAAHPVSKWAACLESVTCYVYPVSDLGAAPLWYAQSSKYGCGKNAKTPEAAIDQLLRDHGCQGVVSTWCVEDARQGA